MRAILVGAVESTRLAAACIAAAPDWSLAAIVTLPLELGHRHSDFVDLGAACPPGCQLLRAANANAPETIATMASLAPDVLFVIGSSQLCGERMRAVAPGGVIGYHPAPLPRLRGRGVIPWTILLDEPITAGTLFRIDAGTDTGPILAQRFFHVAPSETAATLYATHMAVLSAMLPGLLAELANGTAIDRPQDPVHATYAARRRPDDATIDWSQDAAAIDRLVRACGAPYPGARTALGGARITIDRASAIPLAEHRAALVGQIVTRDQAGFVVRCGDGQGLRVEAWRWSGEGSPPIHARLGGPVESVS